MTFDLFGKRIFSPALEAGRSLSTSPDGTTDLFGPALAPARRSRQPASALRVRRAMAETLCGALDELASQYALSAATHGLPTPGTFGRSFGGSSPSADLQSSMASKLQANKGLCGSPEYEAVWKSSAMTLGPPIFRLVASARRTSDSGYSGWPTPQRFDADNPNTYERYMERRHENQHLARKRVPTDLAVVSQLAGWPTPTQKDHAAGAEDNKAAQTGMNLRTVAGWPTPNTPSGDRSVSMDKMSSTGMTTDGRKHTVSLEHVAKFFGPTPSGFPASTEKRGALNPLFSLWLILGSGELARAWASCAGPAMRSSRRAQPNSSAP